MFSVVGSFVIRGINCSKVEIETDSGGGLHHFSIVGLADTSVREAKERVGAALKNSGYKPPHYYGRITVCLAPADLRKTGSSLDLPIAVSILEATKQINKVKEPVAYAGALSLDGKLRSTPGILPIVIAALEEGCSKIFVPEKNIKEARLVGGIESIPLDSLAGYAEYLTGRRINDGIEEEANVSASKSCIPDGCFDEIVGQESAKRALIIIAAGSHNLVLWGSPGTGKTMLARSLVSILPDLSSEEQLETTKIYSIAGLLSPEKPLVTARPFRAPHHTATSIALVGGGSRVSPGEITLAHRGVLFLDEMLEHSRKTLDNMRQPLEEGIINISRASGTYSFPAKFILVGAMNPCPCGYAGDPARECTCSPHLIAKYRQRLSGPMIDRIDLFVHVPRVKFKELHNDRSFNKKSQEAREAVIMARKIQERRFSDSDILSNGEMSFRHMRKYCHLEKLAEIMVEKAVDEFHLSVRACTRILRVARTIADLDMSVNIKSQHVAEALQYRMFDT